MTSADIQFTGLTPDTIHSYAVCAKNSDVTGEYSQTQTITTWKRIPHTPENVKAEAAMNSIIISWDPVQNVTGYGVEIDEVEYFVAAGAKTFARSAKAASGDTSKELTGLMPGTEHSYRVRAIEEKEASEYSKLQQIRTKISKDSYLPPAKTGQNYPDGRLPHVGLDPVNALTGAFLWSYTLLQDYGKDGLHFTVMYDSSRHDTPRALGSKWTYSFQYLLTIDSKYAYFVTPEDDVIPFAINLQDGTFQPAESGGAGYTMVRNAEESYIISVPDKTEYLFDSRLSLREIRSGGITTFRFRSDEAGQIIQIEGRYGGKLNLTYADGQIATAADALGNTAVFTYQEGRLVSAANPAGSSLQFTYDADGNLTGLRDFSGKTHLTNTYDGKGRVTAQEMAGRGTSYAAYDEENRAATFTDELGNETTYRYDDSYRVTDIETVKGQVHNKYNEHGQLTERTDGLGRITQMAYDENGRMSSITHPDGTQERMVYNDKNAPVRTQARDGAVSQYTYDGNGHLITAVDENAGEASYTYDEEGNLVTFTDRNGNRWTYGYDEKNHLKQSSDPEGNMERYVHDAIGRLVSHTTPAGRTTAYEYSATGDLLRITDGDGTVVFTYDPNGKRTGVKNRMGHQQRLEYNEMGQVILATDFLGNESTFSYDEKGNLIQETDPLGYSCHYTYDGLGNCTSRTDKNGGMEEYTFDAASQLTQVRDATGGMLRYAYDSMGRVQTMTDAMGNDTAYTYDAAGRITSITNALGGMALYTYDKLGNLLTKTDEDGNIITYAYDRENRLTSITTDSGVVRFTYDKLGRVTAVQDQEGYTETASYDGDGKLIRSTDQESNTSVFVYNASGRLSEETAPNGGKTSYAYDANGNRTGITDAEGHVYQYEYDANNRLIRTTNPLGQATSYEYDARGDLIAVTDPRGGRTAYLYDGNGNLIRETNAAGGIMTYAYDSRNRLTRMTDEEGNYRSYLYDANGNMTSFTDAAQNKWTYEYDALNRMIAVTGQDGGRLAYRYTNTGRVAEVTDQEGAKTQYRYDSMGRLTGMTDGLGHSLGFTYDRLGRMITQTDGNGNITEYEYSPAGNLLKITEPEGNTITCTYNPMGQVLTRTDGLGNVTTYEYDVLGQVTSVTDALGGKISFTYTADGQIKSVKDAKGAITQYGYDECGNLTRITDPLGNVVEYEYDAMNNRIRECAAGSGAQTCVTIYQYDKKGRMIRQINPLSDEKTYTYDAEGNLIRMEDEDRNETIIQYDLNRRPVNIHYNDGRETFLRYNKRGELVELKDWNGVTALEYGKTGRLNQVTDFAGRATSYRYDANGNRTGITYPDGSAASYAFDKNNRIKEVTDAEGARTEYEYDAAGNIRSIRQPGSSSAYTYDAASKPVGVNYLFDDGTSMEGRYTYDAAGRIVNAQRTGSASPFTGNTAYTYDARGQLITCQEGQVTEAYGYDSLGNRIYRDVNGSREAVCRYNAWNQLTSKTENGRDYCYTYDKRGNLTGEKQGERLLRQYVYDAANRMSRGEDLESGETTEYGYNGLAMRVQNIRKRNGYASGYQNYSDASGQSIPLSITRELQYVPDFTSGTHNDLMAVEKGYGSTRITYGNGYERLSQKVTLQSEQPEGVRAVIAKTIGKAYFQPDLTGSPLFAANEQGEVLRYAQRSVWGDLKLPMQEDQNASGVEESLRFTGYQYDPVISKYFAQSRFYDAGHGKMLSPDPVKRGLNGYSYCGNDPVNYVDPTGEIANILIGAGLGALTGGLAGFGSSAISQLTGGEKFDLGKALGAAANGAFKGGTHGALMASGAGLALTLAADFAGGTAGSMLEQKFRGEEISLRKSIADGAVNAATTSIYGNGALKSGLEALGRGAFAGAAESAIRNISESVGTGTGNRSLERVPGAIVLGGESPYTAGRDPRSMCGMGNPLVMNGISGRTRGYQYEAPVSGKPDGFSLVEFGKDVVIGALLGGMSSLLFFGAGKGLEALGDSVGGKSGPQIIEGGSQATENSMYRKAKDPSAIEPMPKRQLQRIVKGFKRQGGIIQMDDATDLYLQSKNAEGITYDSSTILLRQKPGRASVYEELIHATQYRQNLNDGSLISRIQNEISAQEMLLRNSSAYKLTPAEISQTQSALNSYVKQLQDLLGGG